MINLLRQMNYSEFESDAFDSYHIELNNLLEENGK